jgi:hypothetical protein
VPPRISVTADDDTFDMRRALAREHTASAPVTVADLDRLAFTARDLIDDDVMRRAWS